MMTVPGPADCTLTGEVTVQHSPGPGLVSPLSPVTGGENSITGVSALRAILLTEALADLQIFYHNYYYQLERWRKTHQLIYFSQRNSNKYFSLKL